MPERRSRLRSIAACLGACVLLAGCGDDTVDTTKVEQDIQQELSTPPVDITSVSCPEDVKKEDGATFTCTAKLDGGGSGDVVVTQAALPQGYGYAFKSGTLKVSDEALDPYFEAQLANAGATGMTVDCPPTSLVAAGHSTTCDATTAGGRSTTLTFTWSTNDGSVEEDSIDTT